MKQPIPKRVIEENKTLFESEKIKYTLLVDGNNLLEIAYHADNKINTDGVHYGGIFQFLLQIKILLQKRDFDHIYVFWDGDNSGELRAQIMPEYKANRDKNYNLTEYDKYIDDFVKYVLNKNRQKKESPKKDDKEIFHAQKRILQEYLEELFVRQVMCDKIESDDLIAYYCSKKEDNERIFIVSNDGDLTQLLDKYVCIYMPRLKKFITQDNFKEIFGYTHKNVLLKKIICGDSSDNIKGIKGVGEKTLIEIIPEIKDREVKLNEVIQRCKELNDKRISENKQSLKKYENIINSVTDGVQGDKIYEINEKIINLKKPMLNEESIELMDGIMDAPLDIEDRNMANLYKYIIRDNITDLLDMDKFTNFFSTFNKLIEKEKMFSKQ